jgi:fluoride exporter
MTDPLRESAVADVVNRTGDRERSLEVRSPGEAARRRRARRRRRRLASETMVIAGGGMLGSAARYEIGLRYPAPPAQLPWGTFCVNVVGCALIGILMVLVTDVWARQRLLRPFFGTGVLGGFTTFSTYTDQTRALLVGGHIAVGIGYLLGTLLAALVAVWVAATTTRWLLRNRRTASWTRDRRRLL